MIFWFKFVFILFTCAAGDSIPAGNVIDVKNSILDEVECVQLKNLCGNLIENDDLLVLECIQSLTEDQIRMISTDCQSKIWSHTNNIIESKNVNQYLTKKCDNLSELGCNLDDNYFKCIVSKKESIYKDQCLLAIERLETAVFQDFRLIPTFVKFCKADIEKLKCGRIDVRSFTQSVTLSCLQDNMVNVSASCKTEVLTLSEIQADNIKLDRLLYFACKEDHHRYCSQFTPGSGRVFTCLMRQDHAKLSTECVSNLLRREQLIAQDYRVSKGLMRACKDDIKKTHCKKQTSNDKMVRLAQILLCLEGVSKNTSKLNPDCVREMTDHRKMLMENYRLSPEIVNDCKVEIKTFCKGFDAGGKTIHCLMNHARGLKYPKKRISDSCQRALELLLKNTDAAEDWNVDPVLHEACFPVVQTLCKDVRDGNARVMSCLMDNIGTELMNEDCEDALMQIQYFVARNFKLDPQLYHSCKDHAETICHSSKWDDDQVVGPTYGPQVLPCLFRYAYHPENNLKLSRSCLQDIRRVMRQRAQTVELQPEIEEPCMEDLADFCMDKTKKGEEMLCLQNNLDEVNSECKKAVETFTEIEAEHADLNPYIMTHCRSQMKTLCENELKHDEGDVMECLINHKNDPLIKAKPSCRVSIEHFQLISLKNYKFTYKFKIACKTQAIKFCANSRTKSEVVACLSEKITNDTIHGLKTITKDCRQQLKAQLLQQRENIDFDPKLKEACSEDIDKHCHDVEHGNGQVLECLQAAGSSLSEKCGREVFKVKKQEITENSLDYSLMTMCAGMIEEFCPNHQKDSVLDCLKKYKDSHGFNKKCRTIVTHRMIEQHTNYELNPSLKENCKIDIEKHCAQELVSVKQSYFKSLNAPIIKCLRNKFKESQLTSRCEKEVVQILREEAIDSFLNRLLEVACKNEIETICQPNVVDDVEECLKNALMDRKIATPVCQNQVAQMIGESQVDIQADPHLQDACSNDLLRACRDIPQGNGRQIKCLKDLDPKTLMPDCRKMLKTRMEMYKNAVEFAPPQGLNDLYHQVVGSPSKHYFFLIIFMMIGSIFIIGMFCGRASRRMLLKNK